MWRLVLALAFFISGMSELSAQSFRDKAARDEIVSVKTDDAAMAAAMQKARAELPAFLALADTPPPDTRNFSVKVGLPYGDGGHEYIWIRPFTRSGDKFVGTVVNTPRNFPKLAYGDRLAFASKDIVDWTYVKGDRKQGHYTTCALMRNETLQEREMFLKENGIDCR